VRIDDRIDPTVGFIAERKIGEQVKAGEPLGTVQCADRAIAQEAVRRIAAAYNIGDEPVESHKLIKEVINE
jgi:thymidine phosphorylase